MASTSNPTFAVPPRQPAYVPPSIATAPTVPVGTFAPGTKVQVGTHRVVIVRYLSEGGFAHVYLVRLPKPINGDDEAVLKRVAVADKEALANMRTEVETMKKLRGQRYIVTYIDSHASQLKGGGYEVFLLMEYCNGGGLIDFMNTRLQNRLTEPEVLKIFSDAALGVACMHYLKPPLLHRDLKVENILITSSGTSKRYKLCDFGSTAPPRPPAASAAEGRLIEEDVQKHTTLQYRSPEMVDVYRKQPIDEKSDIWALGVLLYKLCYYKTPFEDQGQMAILNASFKFPGYPTFSDNLKKLIAGMLRENPQARLTIYQVIREVSLMRGADIPIKDIYAGRTQSEARRNQRLPNSGPEVASPPAAGASKVQPVEEMLSIPDIAPMRRGRPARTDIASRVAKPSPSPLRIANGDPFSALDSGAPPALTEEVEKVVGKFPSMEEFSLLHESGDQFSFGTNVKTNTQPAKDISQRVTDALADEAFARPLQPLRARAGPGKEAQSDASDTVDKSSRAETTANVRSSGRTMPTHEVPSQSAMISTGTMTSPISQPSSDARPIYHLPPPDHRSSSQPRASDASPEAAALLRSCSKGNKRPGLLDHRSRSQIGTVKDLQGSGSLGPSLDVQQAMALDLSRSRSASAKVRPSSLQIEPKRKSLRSRAYSKELLDVDGSQSLLGAGRSSVAVTDDFDSGQEAAKISSNVDFLKAMEEEDPSKRKEKRLSSGSKHTKRASMPSISLSGTKNLFAGRFGEAFRRFETNANGDEPFPSPTLSPDQEGYNLTPIAGSEATDGRSDDGHTYDETESVLPEVRRELERRRLSQEEKRVAEAGAAYRQRLAEGGGSRKIPAADGPVNPRAVSIQSKVKSLLDESERGSPSLTKKPERYGRFTDPINSIPSQRMPSPSPLSARKYPRTDSPAFSIPPRKESLPSNLSLAARHTASNTPSQAQAPQPALPPSIRPPIISPIPISTSAPPTARPTAPPKPQALRTGNNNHPHLPKPSPLSAAKPLPSQQQPQPQPQQPPRLQPSRSQPEQPIHRLSEKRSDSNPYKRASSPAPPPPLPTQPTNVDGAEDEDWESSFSKRYPSLAGLEMVETEINGVERAGLRQQSVGGGGRGVKDV
ncbi:MAG: hypothetical protein L6R37_007186 [Teloschistes peruensis]|nr:MAG: hypothetical protein L6R37_007186 [Teloschistes peruensis]